ncbi:unnamed protein product [Candidula unifasciata]|uniref:RNA helicase n=1 Tax=Candidula unifasciata TaxID=100452 RepID=A0A8S3YTK6_9EUPU|nr:unnamed protein product [Candidula unifasciata]
MADVEENKTTQSADVPVKTSLGRGILGTVLGDKVRGIGRGSVTNSQVNDVGDGTGFQDGNRTNNRSSSESFRARGSQGHFRGARGGNRRTDGGNGVPKPGGNVDNFRNDRKYTRHTNGSSGDFVVSATSDDNRRGREEGPAGRGREGAFRGGNVRGSFGNRGGYVKQGRDWMCPDLACGNKNFAFRKVCQKCNTPRPESSSVLDKNGKPQEYIPPAPSDKEEDIFSGAVQKGTNFDKYDDIPVEVSGRDQCGLIYSFEDANLHPTFLKNLQLANYEKPTPIQKYSIPVISAGRDLMACAQTGSGKTAAFLLPVLTALIKKGLTMDQHEEFQRPRAICVAPTRELALQIYNDCRKFAYQTEVRAVVLYGGTSVDYQMKQVECGAHFIIGTPGRLLDVINKGKISLKDVSFLILDEADRMLDMGFEPEVRKLVETLGMPPKTERQTVMFSATFPEEIQKLAADFLNDYLFVTVGRVGGANTDVSQHFFEVDRLQKRESLCDILNAGGGEKTLVFVESKRNADFLASYLCQSGFPTTSIHGDRLQREREEALADFKTGKAHVLVATSVAARGLNIPEVMHVINYDLPSSIDEYVHRIGRTGRCGNLGKATSFFTAETDQPMTANLVRILKEACQPIPDWLVEHSRGMGAGDAGSFNSRFGGKDIRRGKFGGGGRAKHDSGSASKTASRQAVAASEGNDDSKTIDNQEDLATGDSVEDWD